MSNLRTICKCGHDKATHHEGKYNCLGVYCNDCKKYVNEWDEGPRTPRKPDSEAPPTDPLFYPGFGFMPRP